MDTVIIINYYSGQAGRTIDNSRNNYGFTCSLYNNIISRVNAAAAHKINMSKSFWLTPVQHKHTQDTQGKQKLASFDPLETEARLECNNQ